MNEKEIVGALRKVLLDAFDDDFLGYTQLRNDGVSLILDGEINMGDVAKKVFAAARDVIYDEALSLLSTAALRHELKRREMAKVVDEETAA